MEDKEVEWGENEKCEEVDDEEKELGKDRRRQKDED